MAIHYELQNNPVDIPVTNSAEGFVFTMHDRLFADTHLKEVNVNGVFKGRFEYTCSIRGRDYGVNLNLVDGIPVSITLSEFQKIILRSDSTKPRVFDKK